MIDRPQLLKHTSDEHLSAGIEILNEAFCKILIVRVYFFWKYTM